MAETQAKSGTTGTSIDPGELDALSDDHASAESIDRAAVGRASVPMDPPATANPESPNDKSAGLGAEPDAGHRSPFGGGPMSHSGSTLAGPGGDRRSSGPTGRASAPSTMARKSPPIRSTASAAVDGSAGSTGAARVAEAVRSARATVSSAAARGPRRARLFVKRIDPWSVMKFSFAVSFVLFFVLVVATSVLYLALDQMNVFSSVNKALAQLVAGSSNVKITAGAVIGASGAIGLVMVVLFTALSTLAAFIYNVCADLVGGIEVTLSEKE